jgi:hypothetical protein
MTIPDYLALCAELADELDEWIEGYLINDPADEYTAAAQAMVDRARTLLARPKPAAPTLMKIIELHDWLEDEWRANNDGEDLPVLDFARAVLARWGNQ